jgi:hypothetical protein
MNVHSKESFINQQLHPKTACCVGVTTVVIYVKGIQTMVKWIARRFTTATDDTKNVDFQSKSSAPVHVSQKNITKTDNLVVVVNIDILRWLFVQKNERLSESFYENHTNTALASTVSSPAAAVWIAGVKNEYPHACY